MTRQFEPGDVARVVDPVEGEMTMVLVDDGQRCWHGAREDGSLRCLDARQVTDVRPLVAIDVDSQQVNALADAVIAEAAGYRIDRAILHVGLSKGLRSLIADPKPPEPTGLGAVVEDADGEVYLRHDGTLAPWYKKGVRHTERPWRYYRDLNVVRVLSEGVTA